MKEDVMAKLDVLIGMVQEIQADQPLAQGAP